MDRQKTVELSEYLRDEIRETELSLENLKSFNNEVADKQRVGYLAGKIQAYKTVYHLLESSSTEIKGP